MKKNDKCNRIEITAKIIRIFTVPPILVIGLFSVLYIKKYSIFNGLMDYWIAILCLGLIPLFAYLLQAIVPKWKIGGRDMQRKLAFICSIIGYFGALIYGICKNVTKDLKMIFLTYVLSVIILSFFNKCTKIRASGHACSVIAPVVFLSYFGIWGSSMIFLIVCALSFWASIKLKRHLPKELCVGCIVMLLSFVFSLPISV